MNYLDCPRSHLKAGIAGFFIQFLGLFTLGWNYPLPNSLLGWALGFILGGTIGFLTVRACFMVAHRLTCQKAPQ